MKGKAEVKSGAVTSIFGDHILVKCIDLITRKEAHMKRLNNQIGRYIVCAQIASDAGKGIRTLPEGQKISTQEAEAMANGYYAKDAFITKALKLILRRPGSGFNFWVEKIDDDFTPFIVYFSFKIDGVRFQVSFHTTMWNDILSQDWYWSDRYNYRRYHMQKWDGCSSREAALELREYLNKKKHEP